MKKIGIMTWFQYHNYGTALQVTALSKIISDTGFRPIIINYKNKLRPIFEHKKTVFEDAISELYSRYKEHPYHRFEREDREQKFLSFLNENLEFSSKITTLSELEDLNSVYDAFVCGSDQIWSPLVFDSHYFLDFVYNKERKIAYAPSMGKAIIEDLDIKNRVIHLVSDFAALSTREADSSIYLKKLTGKNVETVLDPTLLLDKREWREFAAETKEENEEYILVYMLGHNEHQWKEIYSFAKRKQLSVKIIPVFEKDFQREGCIEKSVGPSEFISLIANATYVLTDSFHGTAFSIIFERDFYTFKRFKDNEVRNQNLRVTSLLSSLSMQGHLVDDRNKITECETNFRNTRSAIKELRDRSLAFLKDALAKIPQSKDNEKHVQQLHTLCCGCGACASVCPVTAIEVKLDAEGFFRAKVNENKCISCTKCIKVCPFIKRENYISVKQSELFSYKSNDTSVLLSSSSGGAAHDIAKQFVKKSYSVGGCCFNSKEGKAKHIFINKEEEIAKLSGSKYIQSDFTGITYNLGDKQLIIGVPCQIASVRNLIGIKQRAVYLVDLICHGVPSSFLFAKYLQDLKVGSHHFSNPSVVFRDKRNGWRERYIFVEDEKLNYRCQQNKDLFYRNFMWGFCYSRSCFNCEWRFRSAADLRIGDYWGPKYDTDTTGVSMMIPFTYKGMKIIELLKNEGRVEKTTIEDYYAYQQTQNSREPEFRGRLIKDLKSQINLRTITQEYILPFEKRRSLRSSVENFKGKLGGNE